MEIKLVIISLKFKKICTLFKDGKNKSIKTQIRIFCYTQISHSTEYKDD